MFKKNRLTKILTSVGITLMFLMAATVRAYNIQPGDTLSKISSYFNVEMQDIIEANSIENPDLIYAGDELFIPGFEMPLGFSVATDYKKTVSAPMNSTQDYIPVSSLTLRDGTTLSMTNLGSVVYVVLEPGKDNMEILACTGINSSTVRFTGCTRGLAFSGTSTSTVAANRKSHNPGASVVLSNVHYVNEELVDKDSNETIGGLKTYTTYPQYTSATTIPTANAEFATKYYVDQVGAGGFTAANASTTKGLEVYGTTPETVGINASSTTGMAFDGSGALYQKTSSTGGILTNSDGLYTTVDALSDAGVATTTATASKIPIWQSNAQLTVSSTPVVGTDATSKAYVDSIKFVDKVLVDTSETTLANSTTETTVATVTIPGGSLGTNNAIKGRLSISSLGFKASQALTVKIKYGSATVITQTITESSGSNLAGMGGYLDFGIYANSSTSAQYADATFFATDDRAHNGGLTDVAYNFSTGSVIQDSTGDLDLVVTVDWSNANAESTITVKGAIFELVQ